MTFIVANYTNFITADHAGATVFWHVAALEFVILALMRLLVVAKRGVVWYDYRDPRRFMAVAV